MRNKHMGPSTLGLVASAFLFSPFLCAQSAKEVIAEHDAAYREWMDSYRSASKEERTTLSSKRPRPNKLFPRLFAIVDAEPASEDALTAANWMITRGQATGADMNRAIASLLQNHTKSEVLAITCSALGRTPTIVAENFLTTVEKVSPHAKVKAQACMNLAHLYKRQAGLVNTMTGMPEAGLKNLVGYYGRETVDVLKTADATKLEKRAEARYQQVMDNPEYAKVEYGRGTLAMTAKTNLYELRFLSIGKTAPEIDGEDIDGNPMKLSDYRGKVVVIDFWGDW
jgi:hypothetical protein